MSLLRISLPKANLNSSVTMLKDIALKWTQLTHFYADKAQSPFSYWSKLDLFLELIENSPELLCGPNKQNLGSLKVKVLVHLQMNSGTDYYSVNAQGQFCKPKRVIDQNTAFYFRNIYKNKLFTLWNYRKTKKNAISGLAWLAAYPFIVWRAILAWKCSVWSEVNPNSGLYSIWSCIFCFLHALKLPGFSDCHHICNGWWAESGLQHWWRVFRTKYWE